MVDDSICCRYRSRYAGGSICKSLRKSMKATRHVRLVIKQDIACNLLVAVFLRPGWHKIYKQDSRICSDRKPTHCAS